MVGPKQLLLALCAVVAVDHGDARLEPDHQSARRNAFRLFNEIHSAGRQWGSSLHHNGMSFFPAVIPQGTVVYHGDQTSDRPVGPEWLSFEVEHAEAFAFSMKLHREPQIAGTVKQKPLGAKSNDSYIRGYLQTYQANRDLKVLYVSGMGAAKTHMGTLDTQDLILRENNTSEDWDGYMDEVARSQSICQLLAEWGYDGLMRMEIGFELVYCDFNKGLDQVVVARSSREMADGFNDMYLFQWARAIAERYDGLGGGRVRIDFSSMVSAYLFPVNISNPDTERPDLPRLASNALSSLKDIKQHLRAVATRPRRFTVNWQAVVDMVVTRFSNRLALMSSPTSSPSMFLVELHTATRSYIDFPPMPGDTTAAGEEINLLYKAINECARHYLLPAYVRRDLWSEADELIHTSLETVTTEVCTKLFTARNIVKDDGSTPKIENIENARRVIQDLKQVLDWTTWRRRQACAVDELLLTVMWPLGNETDFWDPECQSIENVNSHRRSYWRGK